MSETLRVRNWEKWQSYRKDRGQPPWIKIHRCVMRNPEWVSLTDAQRGQLVCIWLLAADRDGVIPASPDVIRKLCHLDGELDLNLFMRLGFLDAKPTPIRRKVSTARRQLVSPETETETETECQSQSVAAGAAEFEDWYRVYPKHEARGSAEKAYRTARKSTDQQTLLDGARRAGQKYRGSDPKFIPLPATWLNQKRWLDEDTRPVQRALEGIV